MPYPNPADPELRERMRFMDAAAAAEDAAAHEGILPAADGPQGAGDPAAGGDPRVRGPGTGRSLTAEAWSSAVTCERRARLVCALLAMSRGIDAHRLLCMSEHFVGPLHNPPLLRRISQAVWTLVRPVNRLRP